MEWHYLRGDEKRGPFTDVQVAELIDQGVIRPDDLVWHPGLPQWIRASEAAGMFAPPPLPTQKVETGLPGPLPFSMHPGVSATPPISVVAQNRISALRHEQRNNWIARHWKGVLPLGISYWVNGLAVYIGTFAVALAVVVVIKQFKSPYSGAAFWITFWIAAFSLQIWLWVGIWRSADRHIEKTGRRLWANVAKVLVAVGVLSSPGRFITDSNGWPAIEDSLRQVSEIKEFSKYEIRPLRDGSEIEIAGGIGIGIANALQEKLKAYPNAQIVHLNSFGGLIDEAKNLREVISAKGLTTFTSSQCASACTIAFMGGNERFLKEGAKLGFHQPRFAGLRGQDLDDGIKAEENYMVSIGVSRDFIQKAFSTQSTDLWYPAPFELLEAHVITGVTHGDEFGLSGIKGWRDQKTLESGLLALPIYQALKIHEPQAYANLMVAFTQSMSRGESMAELQARTHPIIQGIAMQRLPLASNEALLAFTRVIIAEIESLSSVSPTLCYEYVFPGDGPKKYFASYFTPEIRRAELDTLTQVIQTANDSRQVPRETEVRPLIESTFSKLYQSIGQDALLLAQIDDPSKMAQMDKSKICAVMSRYYKEILQLPKRDSVRLLRYSFAAGK